MTTPLTDTPENRERLRFDIEYFHINAQAAVALIAAWDDAKAAKLRSAKRTVKLMDALGENRRLRERLGEAEGVARELAEACAPLLRYEEFAKEKARRYGELAGMARNGQAEEAQRRKRELDMQYATTVHDVGGICSDIRRVLKSKKARAFLAREGE